MLWRLLPRVIASRLGALLLLLAACAAPHAPAAPAAPEAPAPQAAEAPPAPPTEPAPTASAAEAPAPAPPPFGDEALARLRPRLAALAAEARAAALAALVIDAQSGQHVFALGADEPRIPASTTKLFTTAAALNLLGPEHRMKTEVRASAEPVDGVVDEVFLVGAQDFTWSRVFHDEPGAPLAALAQAVRQRGVRRVKTAWTVGEPLWDADRFQELDPGAHRGAVAARWRQALEREGIRVGATRQRAGFDAPQAPVALAETLSEPLARACQPINQLSHNGFADALLRHLGQQRHGDSSYTAGAGEVQGWLRSLGMAEGTHLEDGSGLSRANRVTARGVVAVLRAMENGPLRGVFRATLAAAGERGTLAGRLKGATTRGRVLGKTGTLAQVTATSGLLDHPSGRTLIFAFLAGGVRDGTQARKLQDRLIEELASGWFLGGEPNRTASRRRTQRHSPTVATTIKTEAPRTR